MTVEEYLNLIPAANRNQPQFVATLTAWLEFYVSLQGILESAAGDAYDVDTAVGVQLDAIGAWVGVSRQVNVPISGVFFEWDGAASVGWDAGIWQPGTAPTDVVVLPDDVYRNLIKFKIAANQWDGTTNGAYEVWAILFPDYDFYIIDNQDMTIDIEIGGATFDTLTLALLNDGAIALKPEGVLINSITAV